MKKVWLLSRENMVGEDLLTNFCGLLTSASSLRGFGTSRFMIPPPHSSPLGSSSSARPSLRCSEAWVWERPRPPSPLSQLQAIWAPCCHHCRVILLLTLLCLCLQPLLTQASTCPGPNSPDCTETLQCLEAPVAQGPGHP